MMTLDELVQRLEARNEALERQARRWRRAGAAALAVVGVGLLLGLDRADDNDIRARRLVLVDGDGKERILLDAEGPQLVIKDGAGKDRVWLGLAKKGDAGIGLMDSEGRQHVGIGCGAKDGEVVALYDNNQKLRTSLTTSYLHFIDENSNFRIILRAPEKGRSEVLVLDEESQVVNALR
jgi:hypothetical protein